MKKIWKGLGAAIFSFGLITAGMIAFDSSKEAQAAEASSSISDNVYVELDSSVWGSVAAYYTIHYWGGSNGSTYPGTPLNGGEIASGNIVISATWDTGSTHVIIIRWGDAAHTSEWNRWSYFDANSFTAGSYNYFKNDGWASCASSLVYENTGSVTFGNKDGWVNVYAYVYHPTNTGILSLGPWPGTNISAYLDNDVTFDGQLGLYRIYLTKVLGTIIVFNNGLSGGDQRKTNNLSLLMDGYYKTDYLTTGDGDRGAAANYVYGLDVIRKEVEAAGEIADNSICGIEKNTAAGLVSAYDSLTSAQKGFVDAATIKTYDGANTGAPLVDVALTAIVAQLRILGAGGASPSLFVRGSTTSALAIILTISAVISIAGLSIFLVSKKRKKAKAN
ncbi:MAG TPA: starch-binding protein [Bacilli bacterium]|nr:starch-binding protein [Bacilli bacterium]HPS18886.1 starch-binding protein [Bacilli bacterium]